MPALDISVLLLTLFNAGVGAWSLHWARSDACAWRRRNGCILFAVNFLVLGIHGIVAALTRAPVLAPLGLIAGLLVVGMMWERPVAQPPRQSREPIPEPTVSES